MKYTKYILATSLILFASCASFQKKNLTLESKIPTDGKVIEVQTIYYDKPIEKITLKRLEKGVLIKEIDFDGDGSIDGKIILQELPDGSSIKELDIRADGTIENRTTFYPDGSAEFEDLLPDGSVKKESYSYK